jgi:hypothetical protein
MIFPIILRRILMDKHVGTTIYSSSFTHGVNICRDLISEGVDGMRPIEMFILFVHQYMFVVVTMTKLK